MRLVLILAACPALGPAVASAQVWVDVAGWRVEQHDRGCGMSTTYDGSGETLMDVRQTLGEDNLAIGFRNSRWSIYPGQTYKITYLFDDEEITADGLGVAEAGKKGFVSKLPMATWGTIAKSKSLKIRIGSTLIDQVTLSGSRSAIAAVGGCLDEERRLANEEAKLSHIPADPFAELAKKGEAAPAPPQPHGSPSSFITTDDYPPAALKERRTGKVDIKFTVGADGRVWNCRVTGSSGSKDLDEATCLNLTRRARFAPAKDAKGNPIDWEMTRSLTWRLPDN